MSLAAILVATVGLVSAPASPAGADDDWEPVAIDEEQPWGVSYVDWPYPANHGYKADFEISVADYDLNDGYAVRANINIYDSTGTWIGWDSCQTYGYEILDCDLTVYVQGEGYIHHATLDTCKTYTWSNVNAWCPDNPPITIPL